jgi:hypothetical protein
VEIYRLRLRLKLEQRFIKWFSFLALINIDRVFRAKARQVEGAIDATIQAAFALCNVLKIESSNEMQHEVPQSFASTGRFAQH